MQMRRTERGQALAIIVDISSLVCDKKNVHHSTRIHAGNPEAGLDLSQ